MLVRDALVAEVLADLVDLLEPSDDQPLEIELVRDAQVEVGVELVGVGDEGLREGAPVPRLQDRRLDFDEAVGVQVRTDGRDDPRAGQEVPARLVVDEQVEVALPVAGLGLDEPVEGVRERPGDLGEKLKFLDREGRFAALRPSGNAFHADDVAEVRVHIAHPVGRAEELDRARPVDEVEEDELPVPAPAQDPARKAAAVASFDSRLQLLGLGPDRGDLVPLGKARREAHVGASLEAHDPTVAGFLVVIRELGPDGVGLRGIDERVGLGRRLERRGRGRQGLARRPDRDERVVLGRPGRLLRRRVGRA
jgi:hypothetical protein